MEPLLLKSDLVPRKMINIFQIFNGLIICQNKIIIIHYHFQNDKNLKNIYIYIYAENFNINNSSVFSMGLYGQLHTLVSCAITW